jgi:hypothetical protein
MNKLKTDVIKINAKISRKNQKSGFTEVLILIPEFSLP